MIPPPSPHGRTAPETAASAKQTPLQRHLAHLARHGITGVASGPKENGGSDSVSIDSPRESFVNVGNGIITAPSGASVVSNLGSIGSLKGRFSRLGSISFSRRRL
jgi:dedicator of cytokinesis protein 3